MEESRKGGNARRVFGIKEVVIYREKNRIFTVKTNRSHIRVDYRRVMHHCEGCLHSAAHNYYHRFVSGGRLEESYVRLGMLPPHNSAIFLSILSVIFE